MSKLVTLENLQDFSNKCKTTFKTNPKIAKGQGQYIQIITSFSENIFSTYTPLYLEIQGENHTNATLVDTVVSIIPPSGSGSVTDILGLNLRAGGVRAIAYDTVTISNVSFVTLYIKLDSQITSVKVNPDIATATIPTSIYNPLQSVSILASLPTLTASYKEVALTTNDYFSSSAEGNHRLGTHIKESSSTSFTIQTSDSDQWIYPNNAGTVVSKIKESVYSDKLSHSIVFKYSNDAEGTERVIKDTAGQDFKLENGQIAVIPAPSASTSGYSGTVYGPIVVENGLVNSGAASMPIATTSSVGGIKLHDSTTTDNEAWVKVTSDGQAYISKADTSSEIFRVDLNDTVYKDHADTYQNKLFEHIGASTSSGDLELIHGYFYKSVLSPYTRGVFVEQGQDVYNFLHPEKLENYIYKKGKIFDLTDPVGKPLTIKVTNTWASGDTPPAKEQLIFRIEQAASPNFYIEFPYADREEYGFDLFYTTVLDSSNKYTKQFALYQNAEAYAWKQWNVQPLSEWGTDQIGVIANNEIDSILSV